MIDWFGNNKQTRQEPSFGTAKAQKPKQQPMQKPTKGKKKGFDKNDPPAPVAKDIKSITNDVEAAQARNWHIQQQNRFKETDIHKSHFHKQKAAEADIQAKALSIKTLKFHPRGVPNNKIWPKVARRPIEKLNKNEREEARGWHIQMAIASAVQKKHEHASFHADHIQRIDDHVKKLADEKMKQLKQKQKKKSK
jgi:hypothetical protein